MSPLRPGSIGSTMGNAVGHDGHPDDANGLLIFARHDGDDVEVRLWGELDLSSAPDLHREMARIAAGLRSGGLVVVDASALTFVDSSGIHALAAGRLEVLRCGRFRLVASQALRRLLELLDMQDLLVDT